MELITCSRADDPERMTRELRIRIRTRRRPVVIGLLVAGILVLGVFSWALGGIGWKGGGPVEMVCGALLFTGGLGLLLAGRLVWILFGCETVVLRDHGLQVRRSVGPWGIEEEYGRGDRRSAEVSTATLRCRRRRGRPLWELLCLQSERRGLLVCTEDRQIPIARTLDRAEGAYLITAVRMLMQIP
ncbi:MAG TPA: hypothetical protein VKW04_13365 [Planctomycetota bacterium]|nr:hypothetical protein [Planctomycetota bacterium]